MTNSNPAHKHIFLPILASVWRPRTEYGDSTYGYGYTTHVQLGGADESLLKLPVLTVFTKKNLNFLQGHASSQKEIKDLHRKYDRIQHTIEVICEVFSPISRFFHRKFNNFKIFHLN